MKERLKKKTALLGRHKKKALAASLVLAALLAICWGCSPQASDTQVGTGEKAKSSTADKTKGTEGAGTGTQGYQDELGQFSGFPGTGRFVDNLAALPGFYKNAEKNAANGEANTPRRYIDRNGFLVQPVPADPAGRNISYLDADNRGCTSCHTLENALMSLPTYHRLIFFGYPTEQGYQNCIACHSLSYSGIALSDPIHTIHFNSTMFVEDDKGTCQSCHYLSPRTGKFERWDEVKYNLYHGITDVSAKDAGIKVTYDQSTITPPENRVFKTIKDEPREWLTDDAVVDETIYQNWVISLDGDCENPAAMTLPDLEAKFGTVKQVMKMDCTINGVGQATIMQCEVEGIPLKAVIEYAKPKAGANVLSPIGSDGYNYAQMGLDWLIDNDALIVTRMDGEYLPNSQGYPCMIWVYKTSGGNFTKRISNLTFMTLPVDEIDSQLYIGQFTDDRTGEIYSKPNSGILNYPTGVVLSGDAAKTVHLEGFADAWDEPIKTVEFSFDRGKTWTVLETPNNNADYWTYWRLDFEPPSKGAYLLEIRTTSITPDKAERVCQYNTQFMFTVE